MTLPAGSSSPPERRRCRQYQTKPAPTKTLQGLEAAGGFKEIRQGVALRRVRRTRTGAAGDSSGAGMSAGTPEERCRTFGSHVDALGRQAAISTNGSRVQDWQRTNGLEGAKRFTRGSNRWKSLRRKGAASSLKGVGGRRAPGQRRDRRAGFVRQVSQERRVVALVVNAR